MGVKQLKTFVTKNRLVKRIDLDTLARGYGSRTDVTAKIAVDGLSTCHHFYRGLEQFCGGEWISYFNRLQEFVQGLKKIHIELIWFFDGGVPEKKLDTWVSRREKDIEVLREIFADLKAYGEYRGEMSVIPSNLADSTAYMLMAIGEEVHYTGVTEADAVIAAYAKEHSECFAIISNDTDFLIFDCNTPYVIEIESIDLSNSTADAFDQNMLVSALNVRIGQLSVFAALAGNDFIKFNDPCHKELRGWLFRSRLHDGDIMRTIGTVTRAYWTVDADQTIAQILSYSDVDVYSKKTHALTMSKAADFYKISKQDLDELVAPVALHNNQQSSVPDQLIELAWHRLCKGKFTDDAYVMMLGEPRFKCGRIEDYKNPVGVVHTYWDVTSRLSGLLQGIKPTSSPVHTLVYLADGRKADISKPEKMEAVPWDGPPLKDLWDSNCTSKTKLEAVKLLLGVEIDNLEEFPECVRAPLLLLIYLRQMPSAATGAILTRPEEAAFLAQVLDPSALKDNVQPRLTARGAHLGSVLVEGIVTVVQVLKVCDDPWPMTTSCMLWGFFQGSTFSKKCCAVGSGDEMMGLSVEQFELLKKLLDVLDNY